MKIAVARFITVALLLTMSAAQSAEVIVNQSGDYTPGQTPILGTLRDAITNRASPGDTIVFRGKGKNVSINSLLTIPRRLIGLKIQGRATIRSAGDSTAGFFILADDVAVNNITFRDFSVNVNDFQRLDFPINGSTIVNSKFLGTSSLYLGLVNDCTVDMNHFNTHAPATEALYVSRTERCNITSNRITSKNFIALFESDGQALNISSNKVFGGGIRTLAHDGLIFQNEVHGNIGIEIFPPDFENSSGQLTIRDNTVTRIFVERTFIDVDGNTINARNDPAHPTALHLRNGEAREPQGPVLIRNNKIYNGQYGLVYLGMAQSAEAEIAGNVVSGCTLAGIAVEGAMHVLVERNNVSNCGSLKLSSGITLVAPIGDEVLVQDNDVTAIDGVGIRISPPRTGVELQVFDNRVSGSQTAGIMIGGTDKAIPGQIFLSNNTSTNNFGPGIVALPNAEARIEGGTVSANAGAGFLGGENIRVVVTGVSFSNNTGPGIDLLPNEVTPNGEIKIANGDIDWPEDLRLDPVRLTLVGNAGRGEIVELFKVEAEPREGNPDNGEGEVFLGYATADQNGVFVYPTDGILDCGQRESLTTTATGYAGTSEFSPNLKCEFPDPGVADTDRDGVVDSADQCPDTPPGAIVDASGCETVETAMVDLGFAFIVTLDPACNLDFLLAAGTCTNSSVEWPNDAALDCTNPGASVAITGDEEITGQNCDGFSSPGIAKLDCTDAACTYQQGKAASCEGPPGSCEITRADGSREAGCDVELECKVIIAGSAITTLLEKASIKVVKETIGGDGQFLFEALVENVLGSQTELGEWSISTQNLTGLSSANIIIATDDDGTRISLFEKRGSSPFELISVTCAEEQAIIFDAGNNAVRISHVLFPGDETTCVFTNALQTNTAPVANAGPDQSGFTFSPIALDGSGSSDADGDPLIFEWFVALAPAGSIATIEDPSAATTTFTPDVAGTYQFTLNVSDGSDTVSDDVFFFITPLNSPPVADAGDDQNVDVGELVQLAGTGFDPDLNDTLEFTWSFVSVPPGSAVIMNSTSGDEVASFTPDLPGSYTVRLTVSDGLASSTDDAVITVTAANTPPVADAGPNQTGFVNSPVQLDGTGSMDADGDDVAYQWVLIIAPLGSTATLDDPMSATPVYEPDIAGDVVFQLTVSDGKDSASDQLTLTVFEPNTPPVADAGNDQEAFLGDVVPLIGTGFDPDPQDLEFTWTLELAPAGSAAVINSANGDEVASFAPDLVGIYVARITVSDGIDEDFADVQIRVGKRIDLGFAELESFDKDCSELALDDGLFCFATRANFDNGAALDCDQPGAAIGLTDVQQLTGQFCVGFSSPGIEALNCSTAACTYNPGETLSCEGPVGSCDLSYTDGTQEAGCAELDCTVILGDDVVGSPLQRASITILKETVGDDGEFAFGGRYIDIGFNWHNFPTWRIRTENFVGIQSAKIILTPDVDGTLVEFSENLAPGLFELTSVTCPEDRNAQLVQILLFPDDAKTCVFTNTLLVDTDGDGFPDSEDKCPDYAGGDMGCAVVGSIDNVTFYCGDVTTCHISPGGSDCVNCSVEQNDGWWSMSCGLASETGGCFVIPGTDTGFCSNGCDIETPGISFHCGADASCDIGGSILDDLTAQCSSAPDGSGCDGTTGSGIDLGCPNGPCHLTISSLALQADAESIRVDVNKNTIDGDGTFGFTIDQSVGLNGEPLIQSHAFDLQTVGGVSIWRSHILGHLEPFDVAELNSPDTDWMLESVDCSPAPAFSAGSSVSFAASLSGTTITCTFTNRNAGTPPLGHQPMPFGKTQPEGISRVSKQAFSSASPAVATAGPHDVLIADFDGFVILDPATGGASWWSDFFNTPYFGGIVLDNDQVPGADVIITYGPNLWTYRRFIPGQGFGLTAVQFRTTTDFTHIGDDPDISAGLETASSLRQIRLWTPRQGSTEWDVIFAVDEFPLRPYGLPVSAYMDRLPTTDTTARVLLVTDGQPGALIIGNPQSNFTVAKIGNVGNDPRKVRCAGGICAVSNFGSNTLTIVTWDGGDNAAIAATANVGDGPLGIDLREVGDTVEIISTGFNDNTLTVTTVASDGTVIGSVTSPVESGCTGPGHALWLSGTNNAMYTCNTSDSYVVTSP